MKAILVRYIGPTNYKGSRIIATAEGGHRLTVSYDHAARDPFQDAAEALRDKAGWTGTLVGGGLPNGDRCYVFCEPATTAVDPCRICGRDLYDAALHVECDAAIQQAAVEHRVLRGRFEE